MYFERMAIWGKMISFAADNKKNTKNERQSI